MAEYGIRCIGFDFEGFGKSQGVRSSIENFDNLINDMIDF